MGKTKDMKRKQRELALKERRLQRQGAPELVRASQHALDEAEAHGFERGWKTGAHETAAECLQKTKDFKTIASVRKSIGAIERRLR